MSRKIPSSWKISHTVLIYKKGDTSDPANWRPISLQSTIYKIIWLSWLTDWPNSVFPIRFYLHIKKAFYPLRVALTILLLCTLFEDSKRRYSRYSRYKSLISDSECSSRRSTPPVKTFWRKRTHRKPHSNDNNIGSNNSDNSAGIDDNVTPSNRRPSGTRPHHKNPSLSAKNLQ